MQQKDSTQKPYTFKDALCFVVPICLCALLLAAATVSVTNDMYAFVKPEQEVTLTVDSSIDAKELSELLGDAGVVKNPFAFELYLRSKGRSADVPYLRGEWTLNKNMSYREIILKIF